MKLTRAAAIASLLLAASCGKQDKQAVDLLEDLASSLKKSKGCTEACKALAKWNEENDKEVRELKKAGVGKDKDAKKRVKDKLGERVDDVAKELKDVTKCFEGMGEALESYDVLAVPGASCKPDGEEAVELMESLGAVLDKNKDDCNAAADAVEKWNKENGERMRDLKANKPSKEEEKKLEEKYKARLEKVMSSMISVTMKCIDNERFKKAMDATSGKGGGGASPPPPAPPVPTAPKPACTCAPGDPLCSCLDPPASPSGAATAVGVKECDDYIAKMKSCTDKMPAASRSAMEQATKQMTEAWSKALKDGGDAVRPGLVTGCKTALDGLAKNPICK